MSRREAEKFEQALQQAEQGHAVDAGLYPLVETARLVTALAQTPPEPAYLLATGRQAFLAEAAAFRAQNAPRNRGRLPRALRLGLAVMAAFLVFGLLLGAGQVMADSLPGEPLHGAELALEQVRLALTVNPNSRAKLRLALAEERLDEISSLAAKGQGLDDPVLAAAEDQWVAALKEAAEVEESEAGPMLERLEQAVRNRQRTMAAVMEGLPEPDQMRLRETLQLLDRVQQEAQSGRADLESLRERLRQGMPSNPAVPAEPSLEAEPPGSGRGPGPSPETQPGLGPSPSGKRWEQNAGQVRPSPSPQATVQGVKRDRRGSGTEPGPKPTAESASTTRNSVRGSAPRSPDKETGSDQDTAHGPQPPRSRDEGRRRGDDPDYGPRPPSDWEKRDLRGDVPRLRPQPPDSSGQREKRGDKPDLPPPDFRGEGDGQGLLGSGPPPPGDGREREERDDNLPPHLEPPHDRQEGDERDESPPPGPPPPDDGQERDERDDSLHPGSQPPSDGEEEHGRDDGSGPPPPDERGEGDERGDDPGPQPPGDGEEGEEGKDNPAPRPQPPGEGDRGDRVVPGPGSVDPPDANRDSDLGSYGESRGRD